jgi:transcriptional regulator with XRE-family HTH domain
MRRIKAKETGRKIKVAMMLCGISSDDLATRLGYANRSAINRWLRGESIPSYENLLNISIILRCPIDELVVSEEVR